MKKNAQVSKALWWEGCGPKTFDKWSCLITLLRLKTICIYRHRDLPPICIDSFEAPVPTLIKTNYRQRLWERRNSYVHPHTYCVTQETRRGWGHKQAAGRKNWSLKRRFMSHETTYLVLVFDFIALDCEITNRTYSSIPLNQTCLRWLLLITHLSMYASTVNKKNIRYS